MKIEDVMTQCPYHVESHTTPAEALKIMKLRGIRHLPVVANGELVGVLSQRDVELSQFVCQTTGHCPTTGELCSKDPYVVQAGTSVVKVVDKMEREKTDCALICDKDGGFIGIFTTTDACRALKLLLGEDGGRG